MDELSDVSGGTREREICFKCPSCGDTTMVTFYMTGRGSPPLPPKCNKCNCFMKG